MDNIQLPEHPHESTKIPNILEGLEGMSEVAIPHMLQCAYPTGHNSIC